MARDISITVTGIESLDGLLKDLDSALEANLYLGFEAYIRQQLVPRMKRRLAQATESVSPSNLNPNTGQGTSGGGYGVPKNSSKYADWKTSRSNLPLVGELSTRELVATGHFVDSIDVTDTLRGEGFFSFGVGPKSGERPTATPYSDDPEGSFQANVSNSVDNAKLAEWIEDSKYAWLAKEYEDVLKDVEPLVLYILKTTLMELAQKYMSGK